ncbi:MAG: hypothetical protein PHY34_02170 [Patescibacteria group bacterium]|nr:hypothetical protein [Patescibacteria group bacterium]MDD5715261.1 hypothetical protein [Patescibacteria group bacterium]
MQNKKIFIAMLVVASCGMAFSGYLSYYNLWGPGCEHSFVSCGPSPVQILGLPTCVYGFFMFLVAAALSGIGIVKQRGKLMVAVLVVAVCGSLFAGYLSYYDLVVQNIPFSEMPACVYGFIFYAIILVCAICGVRKHHSNADANGINH